MQTIENMAFSPAGIISTEADPNLQDTINDLRELNYLIEDIGNLPDLTKYDNNPIDTALNECLQTSVNQIIDILRSKYKNCQDLIKQAIQQKNSKNFVSILNKARKEYLTAKSILRTAYKQKGAYLCAYDWQSPSYDSSFPVSRNRLSQGIREHNLDYKRDGHLDALRYEQIFVNEYTKHLGSSKLKAYLTNTGIAAITTTLQWLASDLKLNASVVALKPIYRETLPLIKDFFPDLLEKTPTSSQELVSYLEEVQPSVIFCDAVTNRGNILSHDIQTILNWAAEKTKHSIAIVIDNTCLPMPLLSMNLLDKLPDNVIVMLVESLAKHHQFGMDAITGGIAVLHASENLHESFYKLRTRLGTNITDVSVGSLPTPNKKRLMARMRRHSRNVQFLASKLKSFIDNTNGAIESISWLQNGTEGAPWYRSAYLSLKFHKAFLSADFYGQFEHEVLNLSQKRNLPMVLGTSFGFDINRLYLLPATADEDSIVRISIGTENQSEMEIFAEIIETLNSELGRRWRALPYKQVSVNESVR